MKNATGVLLVGLLGWLVAVNGWLLVHHPGTSTAWAAGRTAAMAGAAWVLYVRFAGSRGGEGAPWFAGDPGLRVGRGLYGLALVPFGVAHFTFAARTISMVPAWLPWHRFWAYFFGATFIAAGVAVIADAYARLASALSAVQLGLFTVLVWVPAMFGRPTASDWAEFVTSCVLTAAAWVVADSYGGTA